MKFGTWIRAHRLRQGLSMDRVCQQVQLSKAYLSLIENTQKGPPKDSIVSEIAEALGLDQEDLLMRAHRERFPEDVLELRQLIEMMQKSMESLQQFEPGRAESSSIPQLATADTEGIASSLKEAIKGLERLAPLDSGDDEELFGEIENLRSEERDFLLSVIREVKRLRPRRGPQEVLSA